jgi:hypothetical protein
VKKKKKEKERNIYILVISFGTISNGVLVNFYNQELVEESRIY